MALRNIHFCVNRGHYERRFISNDPCKFIQGGMIERGLSEEFNFPWEMEEIKNNTVDLNLKKMRDD